MQLFKNYYLRWFLGAFVIGVVAPPLYFMGWLLFQHLLTVALVFLSSFVFSQPVAFISNPFIEVDNSTAGKFALLLGLIFCGLCSGVVGLCIARLKRHMRKR
jgi:hypothetical protein